VGSVTSLQIRVIPRSRQNEVGGERDGRLIVRVTAAPVDGRANDAVRALIAAHFGVRPREVEIVSGHHSRDKLLRIAVADG
jgi:uncharacterized protein (TIGR00251 family)